VELNVPAAILARELGLIQGVVEKRTTHQILSNVLLEA
jgi:DNA polymerase III sliding clamp (beta) subunit (PCNA family)